MIKFIIKIALVLVVGLVGYNYFFGNEAEKEQSREMVGKVRDLGSDAWNLLRSERSKMKEGKYDDALDKLDNLYGDLRERAERIKDSGALDRLRELDDKRQEIEDALSRDGDKLSRADERKLEDLTAETEDLMHEMEAKGKSDAPR